MVDKYYHLWDKCRSIELYKKFDTVEHCNQFVETHNQIVILKRKLQKLLQYEVKDN